jgi:hypothetical protein
LNSVAFWLLLFPQLDMFDFSIALAFAKCWKLRSSHPLISAMNEFRAFFRFVGVLMGGLLWTGVPCIGQTAYPMLMSLRPVAVQCGSSAEIEVKSRYSMAGAYQVLVDGDGVAAEVIPAETKQEDPTKKPAAEKLKIKVTAASDAQPGVRDVRIATPQGVSTVAQLVVVRDPVVSEQSPNETPAQAQEIAWPAAICGAIEKAEDVDYYKLRVAADSSLAIHVRCARLQDRIHDLQTHADPIITLRTATGATLATSDNNIYYADPVLVHHFDEAGDYLLEIRDVRFQGNQYWEYCIEISDRPLVTTVYPLAVTAGHEETIEPLGHLLKNNATVTWPVPAQLSAGIQRVRLPLGEEPSNPVPVVIADVPLVREADAANDDVTSAQPIAVPAGINGRIEREGDMDYYAFEAKKGDTLSFEVLARRLQSALDAHLRLFDEKGKQLGLNDDVRLGRRTFTDSVLEAWTAPADGKYMLEVRDVNLRGGNLYPYYLKITNSQPYFELYVDSDKTQVVPGGAAALFVRAERKNGFTGEIQLAIEGLPPGVKATCGRILADKGQDGCIVLETDAETPLAASNVTVTGTATHEAPGGESIRLAATAVPYQEIYQPGGGRGHWPVMTHTVAVTEPADIRSLTLSTYDIVLKPGESQKIEVKIDRMTGFMANVTLDMLMRHLNTTYASTLPPGVTLNDKDAKSLLAGSASEGYLTLTAAKDAPPTERQQAVVLAHVALNFVMKWTYASRPVTITVAKSQE